MTDNLAGTVLDGAVLIEDARTIAAVFTLLKTEGLFIGASSALNCVAAGDVAKRLGPGDYGLNIHQTQRIILCPRVIQCHPVTHSVFIPALSLTTSGHTIVTVICDGAARYASRLFSKSWLTSKGLLEHVPKDCLSLVSLP